MGEFRNVLPIIFKCCSLGLDLLLALTCNLSQTGLTTPHPLNDVIMVQYKPFYIGHYFEMT